MKRRKMMDTGEKKEKKEHKAKRDGIYISSRAPLLAYILI